MRSRLWAQVLFAMGLGICVGLVLGPETGVVSESTARTLGAWFGIPGKLFLGLIAIVLVPLVFSSIVGGLAGGNSNEALRKIGLKLGAFIILTTTIASLIGVALAQLLRPGDGLDLPAAAPAQVPPSGMHSFDFKMLPDLLVGVLPTNAAASVIEGDLLAVVILAILAGLAATQVRTEQARPFLALLDSLMSISMTVVKWAMMLTPLAVFGLMAQLMMQIGLGSIMGLLTYVSTVLLGLVLLFAIYIISLRVLGGHGLGTFLQAAGQNLLLAFSTSSSSAVMPTTIQAARRLGVPEPVANLVVPVGATMNMAGTALYQSVAILFLAQMAGVDLHGAEVFLLVGTLVASSIGAPGTPGVSIAILASVATGFGIPAEGLVIILGVDRLLDMCRTVVNVTGDLTAATLLRNAIKVD
ncbi:dicarboxylate/amino acid:cation symporter [Altererythrobacter sp. KTW20L]|uniref:dicarboxylate/amino acid:cation symporter n=1 Tax=Altererythrobacter sp. KTW20L TaxID=2942210 RepID=UPI0020BD83FC|nr:dicarboxylate/amino acid:cation symporter [Altererythrobacter sp. KTW20L]MCL6251393.1 dicarboxylate/amino acid:cation symporter [Altererythrobacter sp. KTW20L]